MDPTKTGAVIAVTRKKLGLTQKDLANKLSITDKAVSKWERGLCMPDISVLLPLSEVLNISITELLKGEKDKEEINEIVTETIQHSNHEIRKSRRQMMIICFLIVVLTLTISLVAIKCSYERQDRSGITDRDTLYSIDYYRNYEEDFQEMSNQLPLQWHRTGVKINEKTVELNYAKPYLEIVGAYNDQAYVKEAMLHVSAVLFVTVDDIDSVAFLFEDCTYTVQKTVLRQAFAIENYADLETVENWETIVCERLRKESFVEEVFRIFTVQKD